MEKSFRKHLDLIRNRPASMIGKKSILLLDVYLTGFFQCARINAIKRPFDDFPEFDLFDSFIKQKLKADISSLNGTYILFYHYQKDEEKAFDAYFLLLDEFIEKIK